MNAQVKPPFVLLPNKQQAEFLINERRAWDQRQRQIASNNGLPVDWGMQQNAALMGNATVLPRDVWKEYDEQGIMIQRDVLAVFNDLAASVGKSLPIGKLLHYFKQVSDSSTTNITLDGRSKAKLDQPKVTYLGTPVPIIDSTYGFGWRQVAAAQSEGMSLEPDANANAQRKVAEKLEDLTLNGDSDIVVGGSVLYGLRNHPKRNTRSTGVTLNAATGAQWITEVNATLTKLHADNFYAPATLYVNWNDWFYATQTDYSTSYPNKTIAQRVLENGGVASVVPASDVPANEIIAVVKRREVLQVLNAMPIVTRAQFRANPEDDYNFVVMAAAALEIRYDNSDNCGIAHSS